MNLVTYVYYSHSKVAQLYKQLAESRVVAQKSSTSHSNHLRLDLHPHQPEHHRHRHHFDNSQNESWHNEAHHDKHEIYQLQRVLSTLRRSNQLKCARKATTFCPGTYYEVQGCFSPQSTEAPEGYVWLRSNEARLLCRLEHAVFDELWACGDSLPLCGVVLALCCGDALCGLPLALWLK